MKFVIMNNEDEAVFETKFPSEAVTYFHATEYDELAHIRAMFVVELVQEILYDIALGYDLPVIKVINYVLEEQHELFNLQGDYRRQKIIDELL